MKQGFWRWCASGLVFCTIAVALSGCATTTAPKPDTAALEAEARRKAEEEAKRRAEEEARRRAEEEARRAEEARKKAEEEARLAALRERTFAPVYFDYDKYDIRQDQQASLSSHADRLKAKADFKVTLEGHCDERGTIEYNLALGQKRAESAKTFLTRAGIAADRLTTVSFGKERPADSGSSEAAWARNRRVELVVAP
jgi:peptidoglycan-associated lipoprotein